MPPTAGPANGRLVQDLELEIDRRGWGFFARLSGAHARLMTGRATAPVIERHDGYWRGPTVGPQQFTGVPGLAGGGRPIAEAASVLGDERSAGYDDPALRIFRERAARRRV